MMQVRALKTFLSPYGMIKTGQIFTCEPSYFQDLKRNHMVDLIPDKREPVQRAAMTTAPLTLGKAEASIVPVDAPPILSAPVLRNAPDLSLADGATRQSLSLQAVRRSRKKT